MANSEKLRELIASMFHEWTYGGGTSYVGTQNTDDPTCRHSENCLKCKLEAALADSEPGPAPCGHDKEGGWAADHIRCEESIGGVRPDCCELCKAVSGVAERVRRETLEKAAKVTCIHCAKGVQFHDNGADYMPENPEFRFQHKVFPPHAPAGVWTECKASGIRALAAWERATK